MPSARFKRVARMFGYQIQRYSRFRRALDVLAAQGEAPFFIQIGANNGIDFDDLYEAVTTLGMPGIAVEPIDEYFASLKFVYVRHPSVTPIHAAIHPSAATIPMYRVDPEKVTVAWQHGLASFDRNHLISSDVPPAAIVEETVGCLSFDALLRHVPEGRRVDVLAIDTEGFDGEILKMIDLDRLRPRLVRFESKHMSEAELGGWTGAFRERGFRIHLDSEDCVAIHRDIDIRPLKRLVRRSGRADTWAAARQ